ncbi:MAG: hypothetical protein ACRDTR_14765 [Rubrobacter sp.]
MDVGDDGDVIGADGDVREADPFAFDSVERIAGDQVQAFVHIGKTCLVGDLAEVALWLLHTDDVCASLADRHRHLAEVDRVAAVPDIEAHHRELGGQSSGFFVAGSRSPTLGGRLSVGRALPFTAAAGDQPDEHDEGEPESGKRTQGDHGCTETYHPQVRRYVNRALNIR